MLGKATLSGYQVKRYFRQFRTGGASSPAARLDLGATFFKQDYHDLVDFDFEAFQHVNRTRVITDAALLREGGAKLAILHQLQHEGTTQARVIARAFGDPSGKVQAR